MKSTIKISLMSGLVTAGVLLCGLPHAMAESVPQNDETYYSVNVPSEISLSSDQDETTFTVSGNTYQKRWLDIDITSKNNFNLKNGQVSIPYKLDKTKFEYEPQYVDKDSDSFSESIKVSKNEDDVKYSGNYQDQLQFTMNPVETRTIQLDCNGGTVNGKDTVAYTVKNGSSYGQLPTPIKNGYSFIAWKDEEGNTIYSGSIVKSNTEKLTCVWTTAITQTAHSVLNEQTNNYFENCGNATLYINDKYYTSDPNFLYTNKLKVGDTFKLDNISAKPGYAYLGLREAGGADFKYEYYDDGLVKSVSGTIKGSDVYMIFTFKSVKILENLTQQYNLNKIVFDSDKPHGKDISTGSTHLFASDDNYYIENNVLHLYNPNGGPIKAPEDSSGLFSDLTIKSLDLRGLDTSDVVKGDAMFRNDYYLNDLNLSTFNTSKMTSINSMFEKCTSLPSLDVSHFDTSNVRDMQNVFSYCQSATSINVSGWNTCKTRNMSFMFNECRKLLTVDVSSFDTSNVVSLYVMFGDCRSITSLDVSNFDTSNVQNVMWIFSYTQSLKELKGFENWDLSKVPSIAWVFKGTGLDSVKLPKISSLVDLREAFNSTNFKELDLSGIDLNNVSQWNGAFFNCHNLKTIYVNDDFSNNSQSVAIFSGCESLVGGSGTKYDPTFIDTTAARIDGGINPPGYFTSISDKPLETSQISESDMSETTGNEVRSVEMPVKEPDELESDSKQNESESQQ